MKEEIMRKTVCFVETSSIRTTLGIKNYYMYLRRYFEKILGENNVGVVNLENKKMLLKNLFGLLSNCMVVVYPHVRISEVINILLLEPLYLLLGRKVIIIIYDVHGLYASTSTILWRIIILLRSKLLPSLPNVYVIFNSLYTMKSVELNFAGVNIRRKSVILYPIILFTCEGSSISNNVVLVFSKFEKISDSALREILEAFKNIRSRGYSLKLIVAGAGSKEEITRIKNIITEFFKGEIQDYVELKTNVSEPDKWCLLRSAKVVVYPSKMEGLGLPVLEALSQGTPVITWKASALRELISSAGGCLLEDFDSTKLEKCMEEILENYKLHRTRVIDHYMNLARRSLRNLESFLKTIMKS
jgi:glycosyltransferase involved in cell wall biosynthesis